MVQLRLIIRGDFNKLLDALNLWDKPATLILWWYSPSMREKSDKWRREIKNKGNMSYVAA
jgi:hypothetical protein